MRPTQLNIDLSAIKQNVAVLKELASPADFCAVVKADAESHGAIEVSRAAIEAGADRLGVALVEEGVELRQAGITASILMLSEPRSHEMAAIVEHKICPTIYTEQGLLTFSKAVSEVGDPEKQYFLQLKIDTGMHRVGGEKTKILSLATFIINRGQEKDETKTTPTNLYEGLDENVLAELKLLWQNPTEDDATDTIAATDTTVISVASRIILEGVWTHLAVSDEPDNLYTQKQLELYEEVLLLLEKEGWDGTDAQNFRHVANSGAVTIENIAPHDLRYDMVRVGLSIYGVQRPVGSHQVGLEQKKEISKKESQQIQLSNQKPANENANENVGAKDFATNEIDVKNTQAKDMPKDMIKDVIKDIELVPAMSLVSEITLVKEVKAGDSISYGLAHTFETDSRVGVIPIGYADGIRRDYGVMGGEVLIRGMRHPVVGVTMDQIMLECKSPEISVGDDVVLIGKQGNEKITVTEISQKLNTIPDEIMCSIDKRIRRNYFG